MYILTTSGQTGDLGKWQTAKDAGLDIDLPKPIAGAVLLPAPDGLWLVGGTSDGKTPVKSVWKTAFDQSGKLQPWVAQADLYLPVFDADVATAGDLWSGGTEHGPTATVSGEFDGTQATGPAVRVTSGPTNLPPHREERGRLRRAARSGGGSDGRPQ
jgi:hypothetical protein